MTETTTMDYVLSLVEEDSVLNEEVVGKLHLLFDGRDIAEIGAMAVHQLAAEITARRETVQLPEGVRARDVAKALLEFMRDMEFAPVQPTQAIPSVLKLVTDKAPNQMSLRELLVALTEDASRYMELLPFIEGQPQVVKASMKSPNWVSNHPVGKLDINATMERLERLVTHTIVAPRMPDGRYPVPLARAFGREERYMLNPFATSLDEAAVRGPIFQGYDLGNLLEEVHLAYIWAAFVVQHRAWPKQIDLYDHLPQAFAENPTGRWLEILEDFRAAKRNGEPSTEGLTRYVSPRDLRSHHSFGGNTTQRDDKWYRAQLEEFCGREINVSSNSDSASRCIVPHVRVSTGSVHLDDVISLGDITVSSGSISGTGWAPQGARIRASSGTLSRGIQALSWKRLYDKAVELGIISE